jgi:hypothetical protein
MRGNLAIIILTLPFSFPPAKQDVRDLKIIGPADIGASVFNDQPFLVD